MNQISKKLKAFRDHEEIMKMVDGDTYEAGEIRTHMAGLYQLAKEAAELLDKCDEEIVRKHNFMVGVLKGHMKMENIGNNRVRIYPSDELEDKND